MVHDTVGGSEDEVTELAGWKQVRSELLNLVQSNIKSGRDDTALVQSTKEVDDDLSASVVVDDLELSNITVLLHDLEELDNDLGAGADENL